MKIISKRDRIVGIKSIFYKIKTHDIEWKMYIRKISFRAINTPKNGVHLFSLSFIPSSKHRISSSKNRATRIQSGCYASLINLENNIVHKKYICLANFPVSLYSISLQLVYLGNGDGLLFHSFMDSHSIILPHLYIVKK